MALDTLTPDEWQALDQAVKSGQLTQMGGTVPSASQALSSIAPMGAPDLQKPTPAQSRAAGKAEYQRGLPTITAEPFTPEYYEQEREKSDYAKLHPWGSDISAHPGFGGKLAHFGAEVGNIAGNIVAPGTMANIPGTEMNQRLQRMGQAKGYEQAVENEQRQAQTAGFEEANREVPFTPFGETEPIQVRAASLPTLEAAKQRAESVQGRAEHPENMDQELADAVTDAQRRGVDPMQDPKVKQFLAVKAAGQKQPSDTATQEAEKYEQIIADQRLGKPVSREDAAWSQAYERNKQLGPLGTAIAQAPEKGLEVVRAYDKNGTAHLTSQADAKAQGWARIQKASDGDIDKARTHNVVLNDMQAKLNNVVDSANALDQEEGQRAIIAKALTASAQGGVASQLIQQAALAGATPQSQEYIQSVLSLRESALALPKELTGGSRVQEIQASALWATLPGAASLNSKYALGQAKKYQANIDRLWQRVDNVEGMTHEMPSPALRAGLGSDTVRVQLPGHPEGSSPRAALDKFKKDHPDAKVLE